MRDLSCIVLWWLMTSVGMLNAQTPLGSEIAGDAEYLHTGHAVSLSSDGSRVAVGVPLSGRSGEDAGEVQVYEYTAGTWVQLGAAICGVAWDESGWSVSLSGDGQRVAIGAPESDAAAGRVRTYAYTASDSGRVWQAISDISGTTAGDISGTSVSLSGDGRRVAIGAPFHNGDHTHSGQVRVFGLPPRRIVRPR